MEIAWKTRSGWPSRPAVEAATCTTAALTKHVRPTPESVMHAVRVRMPLQRPRARNQRAWATTRKHTAQSTRICQGVVRERADPGCLQDMHVITMRGYWWHGGSTGQRCKYIIDARRTPCARSALRTKTGRARCMPLVLTTRRECHAALTVTYRCPGKRGDHGCSTHSADNTVAV